MIRLELNRLLEGCESLFRSSQVQERVTKPRQIIRFGLLPDRPRYPLQRVVILLGMEGQQSHEMQSVGVLGIQR